MEQGLCYRSAAGGVCSFPLSHRITQQICCCSRVGKGWGKNCEACPVPGSGETGKPQLCGESTATAVPGLAWQPFCLARLPSPLLLEQQHVSAWGRMGRGRC